MLNDAFWCYETSPGEEITRAYKMINEIYKDEWGYLNNKEIILLEMFGNESITLISNYIIL